MDARGWLPSPNALLQHLGGVLGTRVASVDEIDEGVLHIGRPAGPDWVLRVFPPSRPHEAVRGDAEILGWLAETGFPAERLASDAPVTQLDGCSVLVTEYAPHVPRAQRREVIRAAGGLRRLGELLGELSTLEPPAGAPSRPGGAWHHFTEGRPHAELSTARSAVGELLAAASGPARGPLEAMLSALATADDGEGLPECFVHPDFVLANVVATAGPGMVIVDWAGAGRGPRAWPLAFLLWAEAMKDPARVGLVLRGYLSRVTLEDAELERLGGLIRARPLVFLAWRLREGRITPAQAMAEADAVCQRSDAIARRVRAAIAAE